MALETVAARFARDWNGILDDRKTRNYDSRPAADDRTDREYVDPATGLTVVA